MPQPITRTLITLFCTTLLLSACDNAQRLQHNQLENFARFGRAVDMQPGSAVVGAYLEDTASGGQGAVYVYSVGNEVWSIKQRLESPNPGDEQFGNAVSLSGALLAVGAPLDHQPGAVRSGSVYIFQLNGGVWAHVQTLSSPGIHEAWEAFGISVSLDQNTLVVGAVDRNQGAAVDAGAAFVYEWNGSSFAFAGALAAPAPANSDKFGSDVEVLGDTIAVSAVRRDSRAGTDTGAVYIFQRIARGFHLAQTLTASGGASNDIFGTGLALFAYEDGTRRLVAGAEGVDFKSLNNVGAAYVFDAPAAGAFTQTAKLMAADPGANDIFGTDVALWEDIILVGASGEDSAAPDAGAVYVYTLQAGSWVETGKLTAPQAHAQYFLGSAIDMVGASAFAGATGADLGGTGLSNTGAVAVFRQDSTGDWLASHTLSASGTSSYDGFGLHLALSGDSLITSADKFAEVFSHAGDAFSLQRLLPAQPDSTITAAALDGDTAVVFGRRSFALPIGYLDIHTRSGDSWTQQQLIDPDLVSAAAPHESANSVVLALQNDTLILGARRWNGGDGRVFVYLRSGGVWTQSQLFTSALAVGNFDRNFGNRVALDGDWLAVSEVPSSGIPMSDFSGSVHLYQRVAGLFTAQQVLQEPTPSDYDGYGRGLTLHNDLLATFTASSATLRVYRRVGGVYSEIWSSVIPDVYSLGDTSLALGDDFVAIGVQAADYDGFSNAGEVRFFTRQPDDSYLAGEIFRPSDAATDMRFGRTISVESGRLAVSTGTHLASVYIFDL